MNNRLSTVTGPDGRKTSYTYDAAGRETGRTLPNGVETTRTYDPAGELIAIRNADANSRSWDNRGPYASEAYVYNAAGERTYTVTETGAVTAYGYDDAGRLTTVSYPLSNDIILSDLKARMAVGLETGTFAGSSPHGEQGHHWGSDLDNSFGMLGNGLDLGVLRNRLDTLGQSDRRQWHFGRGHHAGAFGNDLGLSSADRKSLESAYSLLQGSHNGWGRSPNLRERVWTDSYSYDALGNRLSVTNGWGQIDSSYNEANQLVSAGSRQYSYDPNGNLTGITLGNQSAAYTYTLENRIASIKSNMVDAFPGGLTPGGAEDLWSGTRQVSYTYDAFGRRVSRIAALDAPHGLPGASNVSQSDGIPAVPTPSTLAPQASAYHASDRHQGRGFGFGENSHHVAAPGSGRGMQYLYDGFSMDVVAELYGAQSAERAYGYRGSQNRAGAMYLRGNGDLIARVPTSRYGSEQPLYYTEDILGSTMQTFGPGRSVQETYRYTAYGVAYEGSLAGTNPYGYNGKRYDRMSGLYNYGYRDYNPEEGRWTTVDPVRSGTNWYAYVNADPVDFVDPVGLTASDMQVSQTISDVSYLMNDSTAPWVKQNRMLPNTRLPVAGFGCGVMAAADESGKTPTEILNNSSAFTSNGDIIWEAATGKNAKIVSGQLSQKNFQTLKSQGSSAVAVVKYDTAGDQHIVPVKDVSSEGVVTVKATSKNDYKTGPGTDRAQAGWGTNANGDPTVPANDVTEYVVLTPKSN